MSVLLIIPRFFVTKDELELIVCPVGELVVTELEVGTAGVIVLVDELVPIHESL